MTKKPLILGIETSCDETAASLITENEQGLPIILSSIVSNIKKALHIIKVPQTKKTAIEGINPFRPVAIGKPSIPAPIDVPAISKIDPIIFI